MERWQGRVALVTGASVGIGESVSKELVSLGIHVVGCSRDIEKLTEVSNAINSSLAENVPPSMFGSFTPIECDIRYKRSIPNVFQLIRDKFGRLDICVNNTALPKTAEKMANESIRLMMEASIAEGHIFNIGSLSVHTAAMDNSIGYFYSSTKYDVDSLTNRLRRQFIKTNRPIRVTVVSPGVVPRYRKEKGEMVYKSSIALTADDIAKSIANALALPFSIEVHDILCRPIVKTN
ncbi:hypothetical protein RDWZM_008936 [Blomia tropicalis]|uniref:Dehydrogenase/reductase SDR family member 11 n=1 Tax=Blomia tropicalis TaxID=40697 RepID=A0A9Q0RKI5_BLOTA|nr:hypothetical protein RDWZM_008936 [Blomia tropicalis]